MVCEGGPAGWTLSPSIFSLRASLNTSFRTFRQRNSIPARGNEISSGASAVIRILRRSPWRTIKGIRPAGLVAKENRRERGLPPRGEQIKLNREEEKTRENLGGERGILMEGRGFARFRKNCLLYYVRAYEGWNDL